MPSAFRYMIKSNESFTMTTKEWQKYAIINITSFSHRTYTTKLLTEHLFFKDLTVKCVFRMEKQMFSKVIPLKLVLTHYLEALTVLG